MKIYIYMLSLLAFVACSNDNVVNETVEREPVKFSDTPVQFNVTVDDFGVDFTESKVYGQDAVWELGDTILISQLETWPGSPEYVDFTRPPANVQRYKVTSLDAFGNPSIEPVNQPLYLPTDGDQVFYVAWYGGDGKLGVNGVSDEEFMDPRTDWQYLDYSHGVLDYNYAIMRAVNSQPRGEDDTTIDLHFDIGSVMVEFSFIDYDNLGIDSMFLYGHFSNKFSPAASVVPKPDPEDNIVYPIVPNIEFIRDTPEPVEYNVMGKLMNVTEEGDGINFRGLLLQRSNSYTDVDHGWGLTKYYVIIYLHDGTQVGYPSMVSSNLNYITSDFSQGGGRISMRCAIDHQGVPGGEGTIVGPPDWPLEGSRKASQASQEKVFRVVDTTIR